MRRVAVTGFGVVSPTGSGKKAFFASLAAGRSGIAAISHFDAGSFDVRLAGEVKDFLSLPGPVASVAADDRKVGFAYAACVEAISQAGIGSLGESALVHLGTSLEVFDLAKVIHEGKADFKSAAAKGLMDGSVTLQLPLDTAARLIAAELGMPGRTLTNCSACAAGAQAIGHGFRAVRSGECETAVCGGFDSMINPLGVGGFQLLGALTTANELGGFACRPFDSKRGGAVLGEGAAVFVLEPLDKAKADGKEVLAEVCGYGSTMDAFSLSAPDPDGGGAERAMRAALNDAGLRPEDILHISAHGTGTQLNDEIEAAAIRRVFAGSWEGIPVTAIKSMTGHLIAAAGSIAAGGCLLPFLEGLIPPNVSLENVGTGCELRHVNKPGERFEGEYALVNSFGFGGQNASLIMRKYID